MAKSPIVCSNSWPKHGLYGSGVSCEARRRSRRLPPSESIPSRGASTNAEGWCRPQPFCVGSRITAAVRPTTFSCWTFESRESRDETLRAVAARTRSNRERIRRSGDAARARSALAGGAARSARSHRRMRVAALRPPRSRPTPLTADLIAASQAPRPSMRSIREWAF